MVGTWWTYGSLNIVAIVASRSRSSNSAFVWASNVAARSLTAPPLSASGLGVGMAHGRDCAKPEVDDAARLGEAPALEPGSDAATRARGGEREQRIADGCDHI